VVTATRSYGGDLGADPLKSCQGFHILGLDAGPCIIALVVVTTSAIFLNFKHFYRGKIPQYHDTPIMAHGYGYNRLL
jgi:hypothetical protein